MKYGKITNIFFTKIKTNITKYLGIDDDTVVIFMSDNGAINTHGNAIEVTNKQSCKIAYPSVSRKIQKIEKMEILEFF